VNTAHHAVSQRDQIPSRSRSRLTFNEQLCFFATGNDAVGSREPVGWWATLALGLAILPWIFVGVMIWMFV
jgi:hypothetical protein